MPLPYGKWADIGLEDKSAPGEPVLRDLITPRLAGHPGGSDQKRHLIARHATVQTKAEAKQGSQ